MDSAHNDGLADDSRILTETGQDARIAVIVEPVLGSMGFRLVRVRTSGLNGMTLQIMAEREDGTMTVTDCEELSRTLSPLLDVEDPIGRTYHLEISSPGVDRPLVRKTDFADWQGHLVKIETAVLIGQRKRFRGRIAEVDKDGILIERDAATYGDEPTVRIPFDALSEANLILTDDLIRDALRRDKAERSERKKAARQTEPAGQQN